MSLKMYINKKIAYILQLTMKLNSCRKEGAEVYQPKLENFYAPSFPQMGHWNSVLCSHLNLDSTMNMFSFQIIKEIF